MTYLNGKIVKIFLKWMNMQIKICKLANLHIFLCLYIKFVINVYLKQISF